MVYSNLYNWPFLLIILLLVSSLFFKLQWLMVVIIVLWIYYKQYFNMDLFYNYTDVIQMLNNTVYTITACNTEYLYQYFSDHQFHLDSYQKYDLQDFMLMTGKLVHLSLLFPPKPCNFILLGVFIHCEFHTERTQPFLNCT